MDKQAGGRFICLVKEWRVSSRQLNCRGFQPTLTGLFQAEEPSPCLFSVAITYADRPMTDFTFRIGERVPLSARIEPVGPEYSIKWSSSDENIFTAVTDDATGVSATITGIGNGSATLTVTVGDIQAECTVRVGNH